MIETIYLYKRHILINRVWLIILISFFSVSLCLFSEENPDSQRTSPVKGTLPSLQIQSGFVYPLEFDTRQLNYGGKVHITGEFPIGSSGVFHIVGGLSYSYMLVRAETSLSMVTAGIGPGITFTFSNRFFGHANMFGGGFIGFFNQELIGPDGKPYDPQYGYNPYAAVHAGVSFLLSPLLSIDIDLSYAYHVGLYHSATASIGAGFHLDGLYRKVTIEDVTTQPIFPAYFKYYDANELGRGIITNRERFPIHDVTVSLYIKEYMDAPKTCFSAPKVQPKEHITFPLNAIFAEKILDLKETTRVNGVVEVSYILNGQEKSFSTATGVEIKNRNAITWDDDRKAAAFITPMDPELLKYSKNITGIVRQKGPAAINQHIRIAMALFQKLSISGVNYVVDPSAPSFNAVTEDTTIVDFLQYPRHTLEYKGGDCDDLSVLYASLLESVGVKTALVTIPGHILLAFSTGQNIREMLKMFNRESAFIVTEDGTAWVPVEVTILDQGFIKAWAVGAEEWQKHHKEGNARFYPVADAWKHYQASGIPSDTITIVAPDESYVEQVYEQELSNLLNREIKSQISSLESRLERDPDNLSIKTQMARYYAYYGLFEEAKEILQEIVEQEQYLPACVNLGNIHYVEGNLQKALECYKKAESIKQDSVTVMCNLAQLYYELGNYAIANRYYQLLTRMNPAYAEKIAYIDMSVRDKEAAARAAEEQAPLQNILWE